MKHYDDYEIAEVLESLMDEENCDVLDYVDDAANIIMQMQSEKQAREDNPPLTLEQLQERKGKPVYFVPNDDFAKEFNVEPHWTILTKGCICMQDEVTFYDHEPKEEQYGSIR